jgi:hypothetical protein
MGFFTGSDSTAFTSHSSDFEVSGSALPNANFGYILGHDLSEQGTAKLQGSASTLVGVGLLATTPSLNVTLDPDPSERSDIRLKEFNQVGFRFWRLILEDVQNDAGFLSLGKWFVGNGQFLTGIAMGVSDTRDELTTIAYAVEGAHSAVDRETRRVLSVTIHRITDADKLVLESFAKEVKIGGPFLFVQDSNDIYSGRYVFMNEGFSFETVEDSRPVLWEASVSLLEVIG